jgi:hypothetical protein
VTLLSLIWNNGSPAAELSEITIISPLVAPVNTTSPEEETFNTTFVVLPVKSIAEAVSTELFEPAAFIAYDAVNAYELVPYI